MQVAMGPIFKMPEHLCLFHPPSHCHAPACRSSHVRMRDSQVGDASRYPEPCRRCAVHTCALKRARAVAAPTLMSSYEISAYAWHSVHMRVQQADAAEQGLNRFQFSGPSGFYFPRAVNACSTLSRLSRPPRGERIDIATGCACTDCSTATSLPQICCVKYLYISLV